MDSKISNFLNFVATCIMVSILEDAYGKDYSSPSEEIMCPQCFHMNISLENVSPGAEDAAHSVLSKVYDPRCVEGDVRPTVCTKTSSQNVMCGTIIFHARSKGLQNIYPAAVMDEMNVIRDCIVVNSTSPDDEDGCVNIHALSYSAIQALTTRFSEHRKSWNTTEFTDGRICLHDGQTNMTKAGNGELTDGSSSHSSQICVLKDTTRLSYLLLTISVYFLSLLISFELYN